ncbi:hypothetical protein T4A_10591, partial [Trichinella pseudospiralis]
LGRWSARFPTLERGKPRLSALKRWVERTLPDPGAGKA